MRFTLRQQLLLAPATILLLLTVLLVFLQYAYWDLSVKRRKASELGKVFIALAEADLATKRMRSLSESLRRELLVDREELRELSQLHEHVVEAMERVQQHMPLPPQKAQRLQQNIQALNPENGFDAQEYIQQLSRLRPQLIELIEKARSQRGRLKDLKNKNIDQLVARTTMLSLIVLGTAIIVGIVLSLLLARRILRRIRSLSASAGRIAQGDLTPPEPPTRIHDELDDLTYSINRMSHRLLKVVGSEKLLEGAEEERRRIAMDLHDQTLSDLGAILRQVQELKTEPACRDLGQEIESGLQRSITNLRGVMNDLHPQTLDLLGLSSALQAHLEERCSGSSMPEYHFYAHPDADQLQLSRLRQVNLYRIAVEAIHNVIKHAGASRYEVNLDLRDSHTLVLAVEDNGRGLDNEQEHSGRGLYNIRERARALGAEVEWQASRFSSGTRFELKLPLTSGELA